MSQMLLEEPSSCLQPHQAEQEPGIAARISCLSAQLCCPSCSSQPCLQLLLEGNRWSWAGSGGWCLTKLGLCMGRGTRPEGPDEGLEEEFPVVRPGLGTLCSSHPHSTTVNNTDGVCTKAGKMLNCPLQTSSVHLEKNAEKHKELRSAIEVSLPGHLRAPIPAFWHSSLTHLSFSSSLFSTIEKKKKTNPKL